MTNRTTPRISTPQSRGSMSAEATVLVPTLFLLVLLAVGRGRVHDAHISVQGAADSAARAASVSSRQRMVANGTRAGMVFLRESGTRCRGTGVRVELVELGRFSETKARVECTVDNRDLGGIVPHSVTLQADSREIVDYYRSDR
ncbi:MAG: TadE/TadG family type IV pilus assembly protein [Actinomycetota bacterium]